MKKTSNERFDAIFNMAKKLGWYKQEVRVDMYGERHTITNYSAPRKIIDLDILDLADRELDKS